MSCFARSRIVGGQKGLLLSSYNSKTAKLVFIKTKALRNVLIMNFIGLGIILFRLKVI